MSILTLVKTMKKEKRSWVLFGMVILLFGMILLRLFDVMVLEKKVYVEKLATLSNVIVEGDSAPRGRIYDRNHVLLVDNQAIKTIVYQKTGKLSSKEEIELAYQVLSHLSLDASQVTERSLREFFLAKYPEEGKEKIKEEEWEKLEQRKLSEKELEELKLSRISEEELATFSEEDRRAAYLYYLMNNGYSYQEKVIKKEDVTEEEYAYFAENSHSFNGFQAKLSWKRVYPQGEVFQSILGTVGKIPQEEKDTYLEKGYSINDLVGLSYLEKQYDEILQGTKAKYRVVNQHELELVSEEKRGQDIVLSIDINLQKEAEKILAEEVANTKSEPNTRYYNRSFLILQDPNNGEILAMAGKQIIDGQIQDVTTGILTSPMTVGSVVKGASMLVGYNQGAIEMGEYMKDECVKIAGTKSKCSWRTLGWINDIEALALSSNVYQFKTAMRVAGANYSYDAPLVINENAFDIYRTMYHSFGLGVKTEIDLPIESTGYTSDKRTPGLLLDFVMGQFETYTPIQLSQYISTLANGGNRYQPHLLKEVHKSSETEELGEISSSFDTKLLNQVDTKEEYLKRVQEGFHAVTMSDIGIGKKYIDEVYDPSGKTGTSQSFTDTDHDGAIDTETISTAFIGYAPSSSPKMTLTVTSPDVSTPSGFSSYSSLVTRIISKRMSDFYFTLYPIE